MKSGNCLNCRQRFQMPNSQCFAQCQKCQGLIIYFCHLQSSNFQEKPQKFLKIVCKQCDNVYSMVNCPSCKGAMVIKSYISGMAYTCSCGFASTLIVCNGCLSILSLPLGQDYQDCQIVCKNCSNCFKYKLCKECKAMMYKQIKDQSSQYLCPNVKCSKSLVGQRIVQFCDILQMKQQNMQKGKNQNNANNQEFDEQGCKICFNAKAQMINLACFHLSVCEKCSKDLKNMCPICRSEGNYKKVFKS